MRKKALLMILDGWGFGNKTKADVISCTPTPYWDYLLKTYPYSQLQASGENVGLPDGQMGNSEVGHLNIGAGRVVYQDLVKINRACADNSIMKNPEIVNAFSYAKEKGKGGRPKKEYAEAPQVGTMVATSMGKGKVTTVNKAKHTATVQLSRDNVVTLEWDELIDASQAMDDD